MAQSCKWTDATRIRKGASGAVDQKWPDGARNWNWKYGDTIEKQTYGTKNWKWNHGARNRKWTDGTPNQNLTIQELTYTAWIWIIYVLSAVFNNLEIDTDCLIINIQIPLVTNQVE